MNSLGGDLPRDRAGRPMERGRGWGGAAQPGSRLYSLWVTEANAWPPSPQDVGDPGPEWTSRAGSQGSGPPRRPVVAGLTREMVRGTLKSRPPTRRKPQGEGPRRVTEWGIASRSRSRSLSRTLRSRRRPRRRLDAAPRPRPARPLTLPPPGPRPRSLRARIGPAADPTLPLRGALRTRPSAPTACSPAPPPGSQRPRTLTAPTSEILPESQLCGLRKLKPGPLKLLLRGGAPARGKMGGGGCPDGGWGLARFRTSSGSWQAVLGPISRVRGVL